MKILVIAPHMDDEVLGAGGTIARHVAEGDEVHVCYVAHRIYEHKYDEKKNEAEVQCALKAKEVLGYKEAKFLNLNDERLDACLQDIIIPLEAYLDKVKPEVVYLNHGGDNHQDHKAVFQAGMVALRPNTKLGVRRILCYEVVSSTEQSPPFGGLAFLPNFYVNIKDYLQTKINAFDCYHTEKREFPHPRSAEGLRVLAKKRGMEIGFEAAEAFMIIRDEWD